MSDPAIKMEQSFGVIPIRVLSGRRHYLLVRHKAGHWGFPKGHACKGESMKETALRELAEETGIHDCRLLDLDPLIETYRYTKSDGTYVQKTVAYLIGFIRGEAVIIRPDEITDIVWNTADSTRITFDEGRYLLERVEAILDSQGLDSGEPAG